MEEVYKVVEQPNALFLVFKLGREDGLGSPITLHRNLLLLIVSIPMCCQQEPTNQLIKPGKAKKVSSAVIREDSEGSDKEDEILVPVPMKNKTFPTEAVASGGHNSTDSGYDVLVSDSYEEARQDKSYEQQSDGEVTPTVEINSCSSDTDGVAPLTPVSSLRRSLRKRQKPGRFEPQIY